MADEEPEEVHQHFHSKELTEGIAQQLSIVADQWNKIVEESFRKAAAGAHMPPGFVHLIENQIGGVAEIIDDPMFTTAVIEHGHHLLNLFEFVYMLGREHERIGIRFIDCDCP